MDELEKYKLYIRYYSTVFKLKNSFSVKWENEKYYEPKNWNNPDTVFKGIHIRYLWKNIKDPVSFKEFCKDTKTQEGINHWYMVVNNKALN